jgi:hypothetical protein
MVRMLRIGLKELHDRRLQTPSLTGDSNVVELIRYWDNVFEWIKQRPDREVVVMSPREELPCLTAVMPTRTLHA